jgi:hypothetical protein
LANEAGSPLIRLTDRGIRWAGVLLCATALVYFYLLDRVILSSAGFSPIFRYLLTVYDARTSWLALAICFLAAFWKQPAPIIRLVDMAGQRPYTIALASVALIALGTIVSRLSVING